MRAARGASSPAHARARRCCSTGPSSSGRSASRAPVDRKSTRRRRTAYFASRPDASARLGAWASPLVGSVLIGIAATLPVALPGLPSLFAGATLLGVGFMAFQLAAQNTTGEIGGPASRARNFSLLALGYSVSSFIGPLIAGFAIDHFGFRMAFAIFALIPLIPIVVLARGRLALSGPHERGVTAHHGGIAALLRHRTLRRVFAVNALLSLGWDLHTIFVPIYGAKIGLSASEIGGVLSSFAAATFVVRFFMPTIARRLREHQVLSVALLLAGAVFFAFPFLQSVPALFALSFTLGLGLGAGQPVVLSLLHTHAPAGRLGEAAGIRMALVNSMSFVAPLVLGALGASVGIVPVFWSVGACLAGGGILARRAGR